MRVSVRVGAVRRLHGGAVRAAYVQQVVGGGGAGRRGGHGGACEERGDVCCGATVEGAAVGEEGEVVEEREDLRGGLVYREQHGALRDLGQRGEHAGEGVRAWSGVRVKGEGAG